MILAHEEDQYTDFLSIALKQTKAGPRSSGTPFLVLSVFNYYISIITPMYLVLDDCTQVPLEKPCTCS